MPRFFKKPASGKQMPLRGALNPKYFESQDKPKAPVQKPASGKQMPLRGALNPKYFESPTAPTQDKPKAPVQKPRPRSTLNPNSPTFARDSIQKLKDAGLFEQRMAKFKADQQKRRAEMKKNSTGKKLSDIIKNRVPTKTLHGVKPKAFQKGGAVYEVNGQRVTKKQYEEAAKKMDKPKSKAEEEMFDFAAKAKARNKMTPINKAKGGVAKKPPGLYANIHAKRKRIAAGSGEKMRKVGSKGAPTKAAFIKSAKTAKKGV